MTFWKGLKDAGLLEDIVDDLQKEIEEILKGLEERIQEPPLQVKGRSVYMVLSEQNIFVQECACIQVL